MPRNGSGTYTLPAGNPVVTGTTISSTTQNTTMSDVAAELTNSIAADGQKTPTANLPMGNFKHTGVANANARDQYAAAGQVQDGAFLWAGTAGGTADVITLSPIPSITAYAAGQTFRFIPSGANTTNTTVNVSGLGAKALTKIGATALVPGDIQTANVCEIVYDGTQFQLLNTYSLSANGGDMKGAINFKRSTVAATATTTPLWTQPNGNIQDWTGTPTITDFPAAPQAGAQREVYPAAGTIITNAGNITVQGGANYTVLAGDKLIITAISTTTFYITVQKKDGTSAGMTFASVAEMQAGTSTTATPSVSTIRQGLRVKSSIALSGSATTLLSSVPSWVTRITIVLVGCSTNGTSGARVQLGDAGGLESTGYVGASSRIAGAGSVAVEVTATSGFSLYNGSDWTAALICTSKVVLELFDSANNSWHGSVYTNTTNAVGTSTTFGTKSLSQQLTTVALITADTFDGGVAYIAYE